MHAQNVYTRGSEKMALRVFSLTVFCDTTKRILLPWQILGLEIPTTFRGFYEQTVRQKLQQQGQDAREFSFVYVGKSKENLDIVDPNLSMEEVLKVLETI